MKILQKTLPPLAVLTAVLSWTIVLIGITYATFFISDEYAKPLSIMTPAGGFKLASILYGWSISGVGVALSIGSMLVGIKTLAVKISLVATLLYFLSFGILMII